MSVGYFTLSFYFYWNLELLKRSGTTSNLPIYLKSSKTIFQCVWKGPHSQLLTKKYFLLHKTVVNLSLNNFGELGTRWPPLKKGNTFIFNQWCIFLLYYLLNMRKSRKIVHMYLSHVSKNCLFYNKDESVKYC